MAELYSPLRYPGGKAKLTKFIASVLADNGIVEPDYIEPYAGGAGAALALLFEEYVKSITINDADPRVWAFWKAVTEHTKDFLERLNNAEISINEWHRQREIYKKCDLRKIVETGFSTFYLNRTSRSGIIHNGGPIGGYDQNGTYKIDARFNKEALYTRILRIGAYSDRIIVSKRDGLDLIKSISRSRRASSTSFVFLDPPYYKKSSGLYLNRFEHESHVALRDYLAKPKHFPWLMTYDNTGIIQNLYSRLPQFSFSLAYSAYKRRVAKELVIHPQNIKITSASKSQLPFFGD